MATKLEAAVYGVLGINKGERWKRHLRSHVEGSITKRARSLLGVPPLTLPVRWDSLNDVKYRAEAAGTVGDYAAVILLILLCGRYNESAFIYFQF